MHECRPLIDCSLSGENSFVGVQMRVREGLLIPSEQARLTRAYLNVLGAARLLCLLYHRHGTWR
jgi:hypothetical protein